MAVLSVIGRMADDTSCRACMHVSSSDAMSIAVVEPICCLISLDFKGLCVCERAFLLNKVMRWCLWIQVEVGRGLYRESFIPGLASSFTNPENKLKLVMDNKFFVYW